MKIEFEIDEEELQKHIKTAVMQQVNKRLATYVRGVVAGYWTQQHINAEIKKAVKDNIGPKVEDALANWDKLRPQIMDAAEKAIVNRTSRMIKKLEEA
jgi:tRNA(Ser,Leu) C12 N-acetylase TAN1